MRIDARDWAAGAIATYPRFAVVKPTEFERKHQMLLGLQGGVPAPLDPTSRSATS